MVCFALRAGALCTSVFGERSGYRNRKEIHTAVFDGLGHVLCVDDAAKHKRRARSGKVRTDSCRYTQGYNSDSAVFYADAFSLI